jgi:hypothetical protein
MEIWKDVKGYEGLYQISSFANLKSLDRYVNHSAGGLRLMKGKTIIPSISNKGYLAVSLSKNGKRNSTTIHVLMAVAFLNHNSCGYNIVVNHINFNRTDNRISNLELISARENTNQKHIKSTSKYTGVCWSKSANKWRSEIHYNGYQKYLGVFVNEIDAHLAYQNALSKL